MVKKVVAVVLATVVVAVAVVYLSQNPQGKNEIVGKPSTEKEEAPKEAILEQPSPEKEEATKKAILASIPAQCTAAEFRAAMAAHGNRNVLSVVFYSDRFEYVLKQIKTGNKEWYEIAKELRKVSDGGSSELLNEAMAAAEEKVPSLDPTSPKFVFKGEAFDSYDNYRDRSEIQSLRTALKTNNIPSTEQTYGDLVYVYWPRKYTPQVRKIDELYYCDPDLPEYRTYESKKDFKECLVKKGIIFTTAVCHKQEMLVISQEGVDRMIKEELCRN